MPYSESARVKILKWINDEKQRGLSWDEIKNCSEYSDSVMAAFSRLKLPLMKIPKEMTYDEFVALVDEVHSEYIEYDVKDVNGIYANDNQVEYLIPSGEFDAWVRYRKLLSGELNGKSRMTNESIRSIEENSHWLLNRIRKETLKTNPQKGLVMGSVQSGKTANMIGLVTMAAHYDWNFIIILSGTIDSLRIQTRNRFMSDLLESQDVAWHFLESSSQDNILNDLTDHKSLYANELNLNFSEPNTMNRDRYYETYVMVCLKQTSRLRKLIQWLHSDPSMARRLRIIIIDDEADQASINTAKMTKDEIVSRTAINDLIIKLVKGCDEDDHRLQFQAVNYIAYTATPYANVLNEANKESLYPRDFIVCLPENTSYFGSKIIWGSKREEKYTGLDIVRPIDKATCTFMKEYGNGYCAQFPDAFKRSVAWFLCCVAVLRMRSWKKPISMLIHTSNGTSAHFSVYEGLTKWLVTDMKNGNLLLLCESVYDYETKRFTYDQFKIGYPDYDYIDSMYREYPSFDEIKNELLSLFSEGICQIKIESKGEYKYSDSAVHVCVDNCHARKYVDDEQSELRINYPDDSELETMNKAPAFIIIGGNTLSRGLTIEGLVSTFFSRSSNQADSLMQMARWYGYRKGYELLPRIWMSKDAIEKYKTLQQVDEKLRKTLNDYKIMGKDPGKIAPPVMSTSGISRFLLTAKNKSQNMVPCDMDFSGDSYELTEYYQEDEILRANLALTERFLSNLGMPQPSFVYPERSLVWRSVSVNKAISYLKSFRAYNSTNFIKQMSDFYNWMEKQNKDGNYLRWNVAVCGASDFKGEKWHISGLDYELGKVVRGKKISVKSHIDIGSMRSGRDGICDVEEKWLDSDLLDKGKRGQSIEVVRGQMGYSDVPLLLIYCMDANSTPKSESRAAFGTDVDLIGYSVIVGGDPSSADHVSSVMVNIPDEEEDDDA